MKEDEKKGSSSSGGIGFCGLLAIVFITLKLCGVIQWQWYKVLAPLWVPVVAFVLVTIIIFVVNVVEGVIAAKKREKE